MKRMKILFTYFARTTKDGISDLEDSVSDKCDLLTSQEALYTRWDGIPAVNWDGDGYGRIWSDQSAHARKELLAGALSQCNRTHSMTGASGMEIVCRCGLTAWSCSTFRRRQGRRPDIPAAAAVSGRPVTAFYGTVTPFTCSGTLTPSGPSLFRQDAWDNPTASSVQGQALQTKRPRRNSAIQQSNCSVTEPYTAAAKECQATAFKLT